VAQKRKKLKNDNRTEMLREELSIDNEIVTPSAHAEIRRSKALEKQISHLSSRIKEEQKSNTSHRLRIRGLQQDLAIEKKQLNEIRQSISYKIGLTICAPIHYLLSLPWPVTNREFSFNHIVYILLAIVRHPWIFLRNLNWKNLKTLSIAIKKGESVAEIARNLNVLLDNSFFQTDQKPNDLISEDIQLHIDHCFIFFQNVEIQGWIVTDLKVKTISVSISGNELGKVKTGYPRPNVAAKYKDYRYSINAGFQFHGHYESTNTQEEVLIRILFEGGKLQEHAITCEVETIQSQYSTYLQANKLTSRTRVKSRPSYSIFLLNRDDNIGYLERSVKSIESQSYENWELIILDSSGNLEMQAFLQTLLDKRIKIHDICGKNEYHALNQFLPAAQGSYFLLLKAHTLLTSECLREISIALDRSASQSLKGQIIYFDEDEIDDQFQRMQPRFKPGFNPDFLTSFNYIGDTIVVEKSCGNNLNWFDTELESDSIYDILLRSVDAKYTFLHIPKVLAHNFKAPFKSASTVPNGYRALKQHLVRNGIQGDILPGLTESTFRLKRTIIKKEKVSIIIPFRDELPLLKTCVHSILNKTDYPNYEILLISNNSQHQETINFTKRIAAEHDFIRFFEFNVPFNYSRINNWAASKCEGEYILFLNNDISIINRDWLSSMVEHIQRKEVGGVGAKLLYPDETVQHAGVVLNLSGLADHVNKNIYDWDNGYMHRANSIQNFTACTAACLLVKKELFYAVKGFDEINLKIAFNDVDLCIKIREAGFLIVYTPFAKLYHFESKSRGKDDTIEKQKRAASEIKFFRRKWKTILNRGDEYYNPNLTLKRKDSSLNI